MRLLLAAKQFVAPVVVIWSIVLVDLDLPGGTAFALFGCGWISYAIVDTLERIHDRRRARREKQA